MKKELIKVIRELREKNKTALVKLITNPDRAEHSKESHGRMKRQNIACLDLLEALLIGEAKEEKAKDFLNAFAKKETKAQIKEREEKEKDNKLKEQAAEIERLKALLEKRGSN
jgi:hypothetical protein